MNQPDLSVIVPTHNVAPWIEECLHSILHDQGEVNLELIVVDDHSTDTTTELVAQIAARDQRVTLVRSPARGGAEARNFGVRQARGAFIAFADGDDLVAPGAYPALLASARTTGSDLVVGPYRQFWPGYSRRPTNVGPAFTRRRSAIRLQEQPSLLANRAIWNRVFRREFWVGNSIEFPNVPRGNDIVPAVRALTRATSIDVIPNEVYRYRARPGATSMTSRAAEPLRYLSYLTQEVECARLVVTSQPTSVANYYRRLVYRNHAWVPLRNFLGALQDFHSPELPEIRSLIVKLGRTLGPPPPGLPGGVYHILRLTAAGRWPQAARLARAHLRLARLASQVLRWLATARRIKSQLKQGGQR